LGGLLVIFDYEKLIYDVVIIFTIFFFAFCMAAVIFIGAYLPAYHILEVKILH